MTARDKIRQGRLVPLHSVAVLRRPSTTRCFMKKLDPRRLMLMLRRSPLPFGSICLSLEKPLPFGTICLSLEKPLPFGTICHWNLVLVYQPSLPRYVPMPNARLVLSWQSHRDHVVAVASSQGDYLPVTQTRGDTGSPPSGHWAVIPPLSTTRNPKPEP